jgi:SAM-dependent methyltransferase
MANLYESRRYLHEYLLFHYGKPRELCPFPVVDPHVLKFHERIRKECLLPVRAAGPVRALDLGCAVGRFAFELTHVADSVLGVDNSSAFIRTARRLAGGRAVSVQMHESGRRYSLRKFALPKALRDGDVNFRIGDAMQLPELVPPGRPPFQIVSAINLICRLPSPRRFLEQLRDVVAPGGQFILGSPFSWLEEYSPPREWLDSATVREILKPHFRLVRRKDLPFLIREHQRKYQVVVSEITTYVRRSSSD